MWVFLYEGKWHIMNLLDGVLLCRLSAGEDWDASIDIEEERQVTCDEFAELEHVCMKCVAIAVVR